MRSLEMAQWELMVLWAVVYRVRRFADPAAILVDGEDGLSTYGHHCGSCTFVSAGLLYTSSTLAFCRYQSFPFGHNPTSLDCFPILVGAHQPVIDVMSINSSLRIR